MRRFLTRRERTNKIENRLAYPLQIHWLLHFNKTMPQVADHSGSADDAARSLQNIPFPAPQQDEFYAQLHSDRYFRLLHLLETKSDPDVGVPSLAFAME
jgi:hypothetical protein